MFLSHRTHYFGKKLCQQKISCKIFIFWKIHIRLSLFLISDQNWKTGSLPATIVEQKKNLAIVSKSIRFHNISFLLKLYVSLLQFIKLQLADKLAHFFVYEKNFTSWSLNLSKIGYLNLYGPLFLCILLFFGTIITIFENKKVIGRLLFCNKNSISREKEQNNYCPRNNKVDHFFQFSSQLCLQRNLTHQFQKPYFQKKQLGRTFYLI